MPHVRGRRECCYLIVRDSVLAALSITRDQLIVYGSNAFAMLGLGSLYFRAHDRGVAVGRQRDAKHHKH
jgi:hypothetical protein